MGKGGAPKGSKNAEKYTLKKELPIFEDLLERAEKGEFYSFQECVIKSPYKRKIFYHICDRFEELKEIKIAINDAIISFLNRKAIMGEVNVPSAIFRQKVLGEYEKNNQEPQKMELTINSEDREKRIKELQKKLDK